jgi:hypothetical protein
MMMMYVHDRCIQILCDKIAQYYQMIHLPDGRAATKAFVAPYHGYLVSARPLTDEEWAAVDAGGWVGVKCAIVHDVEDSHLV